MVNDILGLKDGAIDIEGKMLGSVVGVKLLLGLILGAEKGSIEMDGDPDTVGNTLGIKDGSIDAEGKLLGSNVGVRLLVGPMLGVAAGSTEVDGFIEGVPDG